MSLIFYLAALAQAVQFAAHIVYWSELIASAVKPFNGAGEVSLRESQLLEDVFIKDFGMDDQGIGIALGSEKIAPRERLYGSCGYGVPRINFLGGYLPVAKHHAYPDCFNHGRGLTAIDNRWAYVDAEGIAASVDRLDSEVRAGLSFANSIRMEDRFFSRVSPSPRLNSSAPRKDRGGYRSQESEAANPGLVPGKASLVDSGLGRDSLATDLWFSGALATLLGRFSALGVWLVWQRRW